MSVLIFILVLLLLVLVHEWGHFIVAKKVGMRVDEFGFGFPPKLFSRKYGETEYSLNALPIGGFVKIYGEDALVQGDEGRLQTTDSKRSFVARPRWAQALVLVAGVAMNALLAWVLFSAVYMIGAHEVVSEAEATPASELTVMSVAPGSAAADAGIPVGAEIVSIARGAATPVTLTPSAFRTFTGEAGNTPLAIAYRINAEVYTVTVTPKSGSSLQEPDRPVIGVSLALVEEHAYPFRIAIWKGLQTTGTTLAAVTTGLFSFFSDIVSFSANLNDVSGPVGLVKIVGDASHTGIVALLQLTAFISLNLVVINLLPFPALDGGRLLFVMIEAIRRKAMPATLVMWANTAGFVLLLGLMAVVTVSDITKLF